MKRSYKIALALCVGGIIKKDETEIVAFGLEQGITISIGIILAVLTGFLCGVPGSALLFLCCFIPLRIFAGGFHTKTRLMCYIISAISIICSFYMLRYRIIDHNISPIIMLFCTAVIWFLAPVDCNNRMFNSGETLKYRKKTRMNLLILIVIYLITYKFYGSLAACVVMACLLEAVSLCLAYLNKSQIYEYIRNYIYKTDEKKGSTYYEENH